MINGYFFRVISGFVFWVILDESFYCFGLVVYEGKMLALLLNLKGFRRSFF